MKNWRQIHRHRFERPDGAVVLYDANSMCSTSKPWLENHRGWMAYGPGPQEHNYLDFKRRNSGFNIPRKFKTPEAAIKAVEKEFPIL